MAGRALQALVAGEPDAQDWTFLSSKDVDLRDAEAVDVAFARLKPDVVVHLAARVAGLYGNMASPVKLMEDNTLMNQNVLRSAAAHGAKRVVPILSTCVFPDKAEYPLTEAALHLGKTLAVLLHSTRARRCRPQAPPATPPPPRGLRRLRRRPSLATR